MMHTELSCERGRRLSLSGLSGIHTAVTHDEKANEGQAHSNEASSSAQNSNIDATAEPIIVQVCQGQFC